MRALILVDVPDAYMRERAADLSAELAEPVTAEEHFSACVRDVVDDALPVALYGWPAGISVMFPCPTCHGDGSKCPTCGGTGDRPGTEAVTPA